MSDNKFNVATAWDENWPHVPTSFYFTLRKSTINTVYKSISAYVDRNTVYVTSMDSRGNEWTTSLYEIKPWYVYMAYAENPPVSIGDYFVDYANGGNTVYQVKSMVFNRNNEWLIKAASRDSRYPLYIIEREIKVLPYLREDAMNEMNEEMNINKIAPLTPETPYRMRKTVDAIKAESEQRNHAAQNFLYTWLITHRFTLAELYSIREMVYNTTLNIDHLLSDTQQLIDTARILAAYRVSTTRDFRYNEYHHLEKLINELIDKNKNSKS